MSMVSDKARSQRETSRKREYGRFAVEEDRGGYRSSGYLVRGPEGGTIETGTGREGRLGAQALASAFDSARIMKLDDLAPPGAPDRYGAESDWEEWAAEASVVPSALIGAGKPAVAAWMDVVLDEYRTSIASDLDVSESTIDQYLTDLRADRA